VRKRKKEGEDINKYIERKSEKWNDQDSNEDNV